MKNNKLPESYFMPKETKYWFKICLDCGEILTAEHTQAELNEVEKCTDCGSQSLAIDCDWFQE